MRLALLIAPAAALLLAACGSSGASVTDGGAKAAKGAVSAATFTHETEVADDPDDETAMVPRTDCLSVEPTGDGALRYSFLLNFDFDHACQMDGTAVAAGPGVWVDTKEDGCKLTITFDDHGVTLGDSGEPACRDNWCGARGSIDGNGFQASEAGALTACPAGR
ncbi:MAG: hypothetical protein KC635_27025 [Myxococcales bacterium]|nr:hypothetical protein [Myxococcales bacterium]MCB9732354.1 hypothetical protein [Deltaproteobacteria bacterium]